MKAVSSHSTSTYRERLVRGFTTLELAIVMAIMVSMSLIVMVNYNTLSSRLQFDNLAQDVGLRIVEAQKAAINGVVNPNFTGRDMRPAYGVYFVSGSTAGTNNTGFTYFVDIPAAGTSTGNKIYDPIGTGVCNGTTTTGNECLSVTAIKTGEYINKLCYKTSTGNVCSSSTPVDASIVFQRPFLDASSMVRNPSNPATTPVSVQSLCIGLASPLDPASQRTITVNSLGQVATYNVAASSTTLACNIWP